jgi:hypothetical protein
MLSNNTRQNYEYKKAYGQFSSNVSQTPNTLKPYQIELDPMESSEMIRGIEFENGNIRIKQSGIYLLIACPQISKLSGYIPRWIDYWVRINGRDVPNSNIRSVLQMPDEKTVVMLNLVWPMNKGDIVNIMMALEVITDGLGIEAIQPKGEPRIPSIIVTLVQLD